MLGKKCSLCGGDLVNGICQECGLNNKKTRMYQENDWAHNNMPTTHEHTTQEPHGGVTNKEFFTQIREDQEKLEKESTYTQSYDSAKSATINTSTYRTANNQDEAKKKRTSPITIIAILFVIIQVFGSGVSLIFNLIGDTVETFETMDFGVEEPIQNSEDDWLGEKSVFEYPQYSEDMYALPETGVSTQLTLETGRYIVGVSIPEGKYDLTCVQEGEVTISDYDNEVWAYTYFNQQNIGEVYKDVPLYNGAMLTIKGAICDLYSEHSNKEAIVAIENPNTQSYTLTKETIIGEEIPAGVYDISIPDEEYGIAAINIATYGVIDEEMYEFYVFMSSYEDEMKLETYHNVILTEGSVIHPEYTLDGESGFSSIVLTPSDVIPSENYDVLNEKYGMWY